MVLVGLYVATEVVPLTWCRTESARFWGMVSTQRSARRSRQVYEYGVSPPSLTAATYLQRTWSGSCVAQASLKASPGRKGGSPS